MTRVARLIEPSGHVSSAAEAVFRALAYAPHMRWTLWAYEKIPRVGPLTQYWYHIVAKHRATFSPFTRLL